MAKATPNSTNTDPLNQNTKLEQKRKELVSEIIELREKERQKLEQGKTLVKSQVQTLTSKTKQLKKIVELINEENTSIQTQIDNYKNAETSISSLSNLQEELKHKLKETAKIGIDYSQSLGQVQNQNKEAFKTASTEAGNALDSIAELAALNKEDTVAIAAKNNEINNSIASIKSQMAILEGAGDTLNDVELAILNSLITQVSMLQEGQKEASKFANISKETKELYTELNEDLESINKTLKKVTKTAEIFFSSGRNMFGMMLIGIGKVADKFGELGKELGVGMTQLVGLKSEAVLFGAVLGDEAGKAVIDLAKDLGDSHHLTAGMALDAGLLAANYDLSAKQAAFMSVAFGELSGKSYETGKNVGQYVKDLALANGIAPAQAMKDIADNTEFFALYSKDGGKNIAEAAVAAGKLGVGLDTVSKVADHLLDYQSSIQDEMEASVLIGKDLQLGKARELMYQGKIKEGMEAALEAAGGVEGYNKMDYYAKQALAKSLGVSNAELQQMVAHQETLNGMNGVGEEYYSRTAEFLQNMGNSLTGKIFTGIGAMVIGVGKLETGLNAMGLSIKGMAKGTFQMLKNLLAMITPTKLLSKLKEFGGALANTKVGSVISEKAGEAKDYLSEKAGAFKDKLMDKVSFGGVKEKVEPEAVTEDAEKVEKKGDDLAGFKDKMTNMSAGLKELASGKVVMGALALIPIGLGLAGLLPGLPTLWLMGKMNFGNVLLGFENLALGLDYMGTGPVLAGAATLLLTSIALIAMIPGLAVLATMGAMSGLILTGFSALTAGLDMLGASSAVAAIGVAILMGVGLAMAFFGAGVMMVGEGVKLAAEGISSMISVLPQLAENLAPLLSMILPIFGLAAAITALSVSLLALGVAGVAAMPALAVLGFTMGAGAAMMGGGGKKDDEMIALLRSIDSKVGGGVVKIGSKEFKQEINKDTKNQGTGS